MNTDEKHTPCTKCGTATHWLAVFPGDTCVECYRPAGEALHRSMTAEKLAQMWSR